MGKKSPTSIGGGVCHWLFYFADRDIIIFGITAGRGGSWEQF